MRTLYFIVITAVCAGCERQADSVAPLYDSAAVEVRNIEVTVDAAGVIEPRSTVEVKSKASGEILAVLADTGDVVEAGTLIVQIDERTPRNRLSEAEAALIAAQARRQIADTQMKRAAKLFESGTLTQADFEQTQLEFANAEAQVVSAQVAVENARISMEDTDILAPITGTIIEKQVEPGNVISSPTQDVGGGTLLMKMADLRALQVRTLVDETDIGKIQPGMATRITVAAYPNQPFDGEVLKIEPQAIIEQNVTMFAVLIRLVNRGGLLKPGMNADVQISIASREGAAAVPTSALRANTDIPMTAAMLGVGEAELRQELQPSAAADARHANVISIAGREMELPAGVEQDRIAALIAKRRNGTELSDDERALLRRVLQQAGGAAGFGGRAPGGPGPRNAEAAGGAGGGSSGGPAGFNGGAAFARPGEGFGVREGVRTASIIDYQFGGEYWVIALRAGRAVPVTVQTGLTDLEYTEVISGLAIGDEVLLLPSSSLYEQQERLQAFISQRFGGTPFQQGGGGGAPIMRFR
jgi:HlyD family secretion protein